MGFSYSMRFRPDAAASRIRLFIIIFCTNYGINQQFLKLWSRLSTIVVNPGAAKPMRCYGDSGAIDDIATGQHATSRTASAARALPAQFRLKNIELSSDARSGGLANHPVSAGVLGLVERLIGPAEQRGGVFARSLERRHSHRCGHRRLGAGGR